MSIADLQQSIDRIDQISNDDWIVGLDERKRLELEFHNRDRDRRFVEEASKDSDTYEKFYGNKKYYKTTMRSTKYIGNWIAQNAKDNVFLDYACGNGKYALLAAKSGAAISLGLDISDVSIRNCRETALSENLSDRTRFFQADAENTKLPDNSVDAVICSGMLHHLDLSYAFPELRRILKPGGKILAIEALDYNPAIKLYRLLTPSMRTEWEKAHILSLKDVDFAKRFFDVSDINYWHVIGYLGGRIPSMLPLLDTIDRALESVPLVNRMAWIFTFVLAKAG